MLIMRKTKIKYPWTSLTTSKIRIFAMVTFKIVFTFDVFLVLKPQCTAKWHVFYIRNRHISVSSFIYKYDKWPHDSYMTGRAGVWEADDIDQFYIALLDFQNDEILKPATSRYIGPVFTLYEKRWRHFTDS
jgi:hypothetical protein